jgi:hypothetical protein
MSSALRAARIREGRRKRKLRSLMISILMSRDIASAMMLVTGR